MSYFVTSSVGVHGVKKLTPPPLLTFNACLKYLLGLLPRTKNADPRLLGVKKQPPRLLILLAFKPCWFILHHLSDSSLYKLSLQAPLLGVFDRNYSDTSQTNPLL